MTRAAPWARCPAWLILGICLVAPTTLLAAEDCGYAQTSADYLFARADSVWLGKVERVRTTRRDGGGFTASQSGYFWMKPQKAVKGRLPRASWRGEWESIWDDVEGTSGGPPDPDEDYVVAVYKHGMDIGDFTLYRARCVANLETAPRPAEPQPEGYELIVRARQARLAGNHAQALGFIRRAFDDLDALAAGQPKPERTLRQVDAYLERHLIDRMRGAHQPCDSDLRLAEYSLRRASLAGPRATELQTEINGLMTAGACKPLG